MIDNIGALFEERARLLAEITSLNSSVKIKKARIEELERKIGDFIRDNGVDRVAKAGYTASFKNKVGYKAENWDQIFDYVIQNKATELLHHRLKQDALTDMHERGETLPGAILSTYPDLSIVKTD